mmetsp:Transcript_13709/g.39506  ORF Transcript_13709/g.39506 Transcript_13709/m.39506 type:complete len:136 (-) Transcript_13709:621-1028(-)
MSRRETVKERSAFVLMKAILLPVGFHLTSAITEPSNQTPPPTRIGSRWRISVGQHGLPHLDAARPHERHCGPQSIGLPIEPHKMGLFPINTFANGAGAVGHEYLRHDMGEHFMWLRRGEGSLSQRDAKHTLPIAT